MWLLLVLFHNMGIVEEKIFHSSLPRNVNDIKNRIPGIITIIKPTTWEENGYYLYFCITVGSYYGSNCKYFARKTG
jgi:hypothetical protein